MLKRRFVLPILMSAAITSGGVIGATNQRLDSTANKKHISVAGIMPYVDEDTLIQRSDLIIKGVVSRVYDSKWSNENQINGEHKRNVLQTDIGIKILDVIKGKPYDNNEVVVRIDKGKTDDTVYESEGYPDFKEGEEVILFLSIDDSDIAEEDENYYVLTGMRQGKFTKDTESRGELIKSTEGQQEVTTDSQIQVEFTKDVESQEQFIQDLEEKDDSALSICEDDIHTQLNNKRTLRSSEANEMTKEQIRENNRILFGE